MSENTKHSFTIQKEGQGKATVHCSNGYSLRLPDASTVEKGTSYKFSVGEDGNINILIQKN